MLSTSLAGRSILIAEDEPLIALDIAGICEAAGASTMTASTVKLAIHLANTEGLSAAVVDLGFPDGEADELRIGLKQRGVPYVLYSAFTDAEAAAAAAEAIVLNKPASQAQLIEALVQAINGRVARSAA